MKIGGIRYMYMFLYIENKYIHQNGNGKLYVGLEIRISSKEY